MIINSLLDTDLYKLTMGQVALFSFPNLKVKYKFYDRKDTIYPIGFAEKLKKSVIAMELIKLSKNEKDFLKNKCGKYLTPAYIDFLNGYQFDSNEVDISQDENGYLSINIHGYWYRTIYWEVPLLALISELYYIETNQLVDHYEFNQYQKVLDKIELFKDNNVYFADMGTRRRYSYMNQKRVLEIFKKHSNHTFVGTSNVHFSQILNLKPIGTKAHEMSMVHAALYGYKMADKMTMDSWIKIYNGELGTVLPDCYTTDNFLKSFDSMYARLYDSIRHDSADPFEFTDKIIAHYKKLGIDPMSKTIIFSDGLNPKKATEIKQYCIGKIKSSFGIGTNFTNDIGVKSLSIVIKIDQVKINDDWVNTVKISDEKGKYTGDKNEIEICKKVLKLD